MRSAWPATEGTPAWSLAELGVRLDADGVGLRARLLGSGLVSTPATAGTCPMVLDDEDRLYLARHFDLERRLAEALVRRSRSAPEPTDTELLRRQLDELFADNAQGLGDRPDRQRLAAALAMHRRLLVISGGPGTGKTTTVVALLACLLAQSPEARIALAAPTGKAAARMLEALRARA
jgi:exodeoxyribonuclease V alpha subunit